MPKDSELDLDDVNWLLYSLDFSEERIRDYKHLEYAHKLESLRPLLTVRKKLRHLRDDLKSKD